MNVMWVEPEAHPPKYKKLILEGVQILSTSLWKNGLGHVSPYKPTHNEHPIVRWAAESQGNWFQLLDHLSDLHEHFYEHSYYELRGLPSDVRWDLHDAADAHKSMVVLAEADAEQSVRFVFPELGRTARPKCMPSWCREELVTESYRKYLSCVKRHNNWFTFPDGGEPDWLRTYRAKYPAEWRRAQFMVA